ncbi:ATP phosphoribosyltransferase [Xiashengella succiniciproducens]|jgi:ATP phosphoribosyltransferase|uniref:ATP phosphoribosyltransferase n=1 Tax=Xiashengella succiniciproducens TaxID=2949635 RepID=A0A9J6ZQ98_9BACT|nr:ATP phosphoribosyltransferase [Alkaliflexus sp. Ai-910]URW80108.1 ATP phosphoribosyltransferase [Alkaliflexus sp. Ai-910]HHU00579.1 ATP phosphoribosyltransferase [Bacteroidales bacterium]
MIKDTETILRIALQKSGRLHDDSMDLMNRSGIKFNTGAGRLVAQSTGFPVEALFLRDDDIPQTVYDGVADIGIVGENEYAEKGYELEIVKHLNFGKCRLSLAIPKSEHYTGVGWFDGKKVATSYPRILKKFFEEKKIQAEIHEIAGSVEIAPGIGLADAIFDIVSSGSTLVANSLKEVGVVMYSQAVVVANKNLEPEKREILDQMLFRFNSVMASATNKYVLLNAPNERVKDIVKILPGMKSPTVLPLAQEGWSSIHSVISEEQFWEVIDQLKACGAEGILIIPIEKMIL